MSRPHSWWRVHSQGQSAFLAVYTLTGSRAHLRFAHAQAAIGTTAAPARLQRVQQRKYLFMRLINLIARYDLFA